MNRLFLICATGLLAFMFPLAGIAQSYDRLWKEVEETRKKDLPQTLISHIFNFHCTNYNILILYFFQNYVKYLPLIFPQRQTI